MNGSRPLAMAVIASLAVFVFLILGAGAVGGSYALTLHAIHVQQESEMQVRSREATSQIRQSIPTCRALNAMDQASHIPPNGFPAPPRNTFDLRLSAAIHSVNVDSHCPLILSDVAKHVPYTEILRQIQGDSASSNRNPGTEG